MSGKRNILFALQFSLSGIGLISLILTNTIDPGYVQKTSKTHRRDGSRNSQEELLPVPKIERKNKDGQTEKFCETCELWRPPDAHHCSKLYYYLRRQYSMIMFRNLWTVCQKVRSSLSSDGKLT
eukprot:UN19706